MWNLDLFLDEGNATLRTVRGGPADSILSIFRSSSLFMALQLVGLWTDCWKTVSFGHNAKTLQTDNVPWHSERLLPI